jgi:hypothetical protein
MRTSKLFRHKWVLAATVAAVVFSSAYAFAASLGVTSASLGAGNASVSSCASAVNATYTTSYATSLPGYKVATVSFDGLGSCGGKTLTAVLSGTSNASLGSVTHTVTTAEATAGSISEPVSGTIDAASVQGVSVAVS